MRKPDTCAPGSTAIRRCSDECAYSTTGDWDSGSLAFAISHGPYRTAPSASSSVSSFSDMLFSPPAFAFRSIGWPRSISSELLLTESEIQPRVPRRTVCEHPALQYLHFINGGRMTRRTVSALCITHTSL